MCSRKVSHPPEVTSMLKEKSSFSVTDTHADGIILLGKCPAELISTLQNHYHNIVGIDRNPTNFDYDEVICAEQLPPSLP